MSRRLRIAAWGAAGVLSAGVVAGIVVSEMSVAAADGSDTQTPRPGMHRWEHRGMGPMGGLAGRPIHGEMKVETGTNTYQTVDTQLGKITAIGAKSLTVKSDDGFTATYVVDSATRIVKNRAQVKLSDLATGDTVHVVAVKGSDGTLTAKGIRDGDRPMGPPPGMMPPRQSGGTA